MVIIDFAVIECPPAFLSLVFFFSWHKPEETMVDPQGIWAQAHKNTLTTWVETQWLAAGSSPILSMGR
jgi:hypothetical protein